MSGSDSLDDDRVPAWRRYLRLVRSNPSGDVDDELAFHIESAIDEYVAMGITHDEARRLARAKFGDVARISKTLYTLSTRRERTMNFREWLDSVRQDVVFGLRQLKKTPGFTIVALFTLALGIGATSAIYSVIHAVLLSPMPHAHSERILRLYEKNGPSRNVVTFGNYSAWRQQASQFEAIGAAWGMPDLTLTGNGDPVPVSGGRVTASYFKAMYIKPLVGRYFDEGDDREGAAPVVILSAALWQNKFGGDPSIVGKTIMLSGIPRRVVGVASPDYILGSGAERIWIPLVIDAERLADHKDHELSVYALVKNGVPMESAIAELSRIERQLAKEYPNSGFEDVEAVPLLQAIVGNQKTTLYTLFGAVALVLLIGCANIANLLIARATRRRGEIAVRGALGASRGRIARQLLIESLLLGVAGGVLGLGVAYAGIRFLVTSPASVPRLSHTSLDAGVIAFTLGLSVGCALLFGLVPAWRAARADLQQTLRDGGRESAATMRDGLRGALVVGELCLAQVLLVGAVLLIRTTMAFNAVPLGFDTHNLLAMSLFLPPARYTDPQKDVIFSQIEANIAAIPGVKAVGRSQQLPIYGNGWNWTAMREGSNGHDDRAVTADMRGVSPNYFSALGVHILRGRAFTAGDGPDAPRVAIISRGLGRRLFGDADPLGQMISNGSVEKPGWREIVGVVEDIRANGPGDEPPLTFYMPASTWVNGYQSLLIRGSVPVETLLPQIRRAVSSVDPTLALSGVSTIDDALGRILAMPRFTMLLLTMLGMCGLILAVVGVYGVIAYFVTQRTHEFGVRLALGASDRSVQWLVVRQGLILGAIGVVVGGALAMMASRLLRSMVFGVTPHDPLTFVVVGALLGAVAVAASYIPARRATRIDPLEALRST